MSNREQHYSRWTLPAIVNPPKTRKFVICVPDEQFYIAAFRGLLIELTYSKNWQRDDAKTAAIVSRIWQQALESVLCDDCDRPIIGEREYKMSICEEIRIHEGKLQGLCCGEWSDIPSDGTTLSGGAAQPEAGGTVPLGGCRSYDAILQGNGLWKLPVPVQGGDTIAITIAKGGWYDGTLTSWRCPDGSAYTLGLCGGGEFTDAGDPLPTANHMRLIALYGSTYVDAYNTTITIPDGTPAANMSFQANDSALGDNAGSVAFHVEYCRANAATWCAKYNVTNGWDDWTGKPQQTDNVVPTLVSGVWNGTLGAQGWYANGITKDFVVPTGSVLTSIEVKGSNTSTDPFSKAIQWVNSGASSYINTTQVGAQDYTFGGLALAGTTTVNVFNNNNAAGQGLTTEVVIRGTGTAPTWATGYEC